MENRTEEMTISPLALQEVRKIYHEYLIHDFPRSERKPLRVIEKALERNEYICFGAEREKAVAA